MTKNKIQKEFNKIYKTLFYRMWSWIITAAIIFSLTSDVVITTTATIIIELSKTLNYYIFERIWKWIKK